MNRVLINIDTMKKKKYLVLLVLSLFVWNTYSQKKTYDFESMDKNAITVGFFGTTPIIGVTYERITSKYLSWEVGLGIASAGIGVKVVPFGIRPNKFTFHTGITNWYWLVPGAFSPAIYVPLGFSFYGKESFNFSFDMGHL